ncbi:MAG TPA: hypothetical protein DEO85_06555, partial [Maritimibacter sp.]|nr:hypothetical protein [Maritimibacter sp.]
MLIGRFVHCSLGKKDTFILKPLFVVILAVTMSLSVALKASGQDFSELLRDFDSRSLSYEDKRFLQTALAFEGHYNGLLDGDWGRMSQAAMTRYSWSEFDGPTEDWHMAAVAFDFFDLSRRDGWQIEYF